MTLNYENEQTIALPFDVEELAAIVINAVIDGEECPYEAEVNLTLVDDDEIRRINREFRDKDQSTDVLSFPIVPFEAPSDFALLEEETAEADCFNPETGELLLGDIILSVPHVVQQAELYGHSLKREAAFLIAHSMLHLFGYDHMTPEDAAQMERKQADYLNALGITRDTMNKDGGVRSDDH